MVETTTAQGRDTGQQLERRRADLVSSREQAAVGRLALAELEGRADALRGSREDTKRRLSEAEQLADRLQRELKKNGKDRDQLERRIRAARKALVELDRRAGTREQKYDRAVLTELVEREKARDLSSTPATGTAPAAAPDKPTATAASSATDDKPAEAAQVTGQDKPAETETDVHPGDDATTATRRTGTAPATTGAATGRTSAARATTARRAGAATASTDGSTSGTAGQTPSSR